MQCSAPKYTKLLTLENQPLALNKNVLSKFREEFYADKKNILAQNVCSRIDPFDVALTRKHLEESHHVFNNKVELEGKPVTNQRNTGRCWIFACLNVLRLPVIKHFNLEDFEFSQAYLFFWDKVERCNFFLKNVIEITRRKEPIDGRLMAYILNEPIYDGGQWDMIVNLINKYGLMPKKYFPESYSCESSIRMNMILKSKLREYSKELRALVENGGSEADIQTLVETHMSNIFRIIGICLGIPNETFTWNYYDKNKAFHSIGPITPKEFYENHIKPLYNVDNKICLVHDPRPTSGYGKVFTVDCLGNMVGGRKIIYNNQPIDLLLEVTAKSIKENEAVWFGCEVGKRFAAKQGIQDMKVHDFPLVFGVDIQTSLSKADRLIFGESAMSHAMVFTGINTNETGEVTKLRVENSWGEDRGDKGYFVMSSDWFKEFVFEIVIDKKFVPESVLEVYKQEPTVLPLWDPMGVLAK